MRGFCSLDFSSDWKWSLNLLRKADEEPPRNQFSLGDVFLCVLLKESERRRRDPIKPLHRSGYIRL